MERDKPTRMQAMKMRTGGFCRADPKRLPVKAASVPRI